MTIYARDVLNTFLKVQISEKKSVHEAPNLLFDSCHFLLDTCMIPLKLPIISLTKYQVEDTTKMCGGSHKVLLL